MHRAALRKVAIAALVVASACSGASSTEPRARPSAEAVPPDPAPRPITPAAPPAPPLEPDPDSMCGRALGCCRAYAGVVPDVVESSACAGVLEAGAVPDPNARCRSMILGWRAALERLRGEAPEPCR